MEFVVVDQTEAHLHTVRFTSPISKSPPCDKFHHGSQALFLWKSSHGLFAPLGSCEVCTPERLKQEIKEIKRHSARVNLGWSEHDWNRHAGGKSAAASTPPHDVPLTWKKAGDALRSTG